MSIFLLAVVLVLVELVLVELVMLLVAFADWIAGLHSRFSDARCLASLGEIRRRG